MSSNRDKRRNGRHDFCCQQLLAAEAPGGKLPTPSDFVSVTCTDLSTGGVALLLDEAPRFKEFIIGLGQPPNLILMSARVVHCEITDDCGAIRYRVGCQFTGHAAYDAQAGRFTRVAEDRAPEKGKRAAKAR